MLKIVSPADTEPVTLTEIRQHLRLPLEPAEDELLLSLIKTARVYCEDFTRRSLAEQTLELYLDRFPTDGAVLLPSPPLRVVVEIGVRNNAGIESILPSSDYLVAENCEPAQVLPANGRTWPVFTPYPAAPIRIRFSAGYELLPEPIRQAILLLAGHWYENREATGTAKDEAAFSVHALLMPYRMEVF